ncbi:Creatinine amidohydrolase [Arcticibacter svalbardensis MN12-7]|uniref:Creatinine amidohydrolase n=2 Tax=Arcticibacter TaxID=1288026 RepID=R9GYQ8_9SPHI|nr:Creatinine amidohydrolase [Arcticibacter svalbardensis MN12-7]
MFPDQIREAIDKNVPVALALGVLEYHGEHLSPGVDTLLVVRALEMIEKEMPIVIFPPFYYGASSFAVEPPERNGTVHIDSQILQPFARQLFYNLLRIGFRNIHVFIHHQCENFSEGMPTDLSFKLAARQETFAFIEKENGEGWWGNISFAEYYKDHAAGDSPFNWINVHPFMSTEVQAEFPIDHAGEQETSLMMAFCPEAVDMGRYSDEKWYSKSALNASLDYGNRAKTVILNHIKDKLSKGC